MFDLEILHEVLLLEPSRFDGIHNLREKFRLEEQFIGIGKPQILEYVYHAFFDVFSIHFPFLIFWRLVYLFFRSINRFRLASMIFISRRGV